MARLNLEVEGVPVVIKAAVAKDLPVSVLLGTDAPELENLLGLKPRSRRSKRQRALLAVTSARAKREAQEEKERCQKEADSQVYSSPVVLDAQSIAEEGAAKKPWRGIKLAKQGEIMDQSSTLRTVCSQAAGEGANSQGVRRELRGGYTD